MLLNVSTKKCHYFAFKEIINYNKKTLIPFLGSISAALLKSGLLAYAALLNSS